MNRTADRELTRACSCERSALQLSDLQKPACGRDVLAGVLSAGLRLCLDEEAFAQVTLLYFDGCPNWETTYRQLKTLSADLEYLQSP